MGVNRDDEPNDDAEDRSKPGRPDFLDFLIKVLREHEQQLSSTTENLVDLYDRMKRDQENSTEILTRIVKEIEDTATHTSTRPIVIQCHNWEDVKRHRTGARIVTFETRDNRFVVTMIADEIYEFSEPLPTKTLLVRKDQDRFILDRFIINDLDHVPHFFKHTLDCGLTGTYQTGNVDVPDGGHRLTMRYTIDPHTARTFLVKELQVPETKIVEGRIRSLNYLEGRIRSLNYLEQGNRC